jgi:Ni,Fe-hydrogenase III large subunit
MTKSEAEQLFKKLDRINERVEDIRDDFQWDYETTDRATADMIADHLARACEALGLAGRAIHTAYQLRDAEEILSGD